jgi:PilZ domain-containing protein
MSDTAPPSSNRRAGERYVACSLAALQRPDGQQRPSLIHDLSESGALLLVRTTKVSVDDEVTLQLYIAEDAETCRTATGRVVRVEELVPGEAGPWLRRVAVQFHEPLTMYAEDIESFRRRAARLGMAR